MIRNLSKYFYCFLKTNCFTPWCIFFNVAITFSRLCCSINSILKYKKNYLFISLRIFYQLLNICIKFVEYSILPFQIWLNYVNLIEKWFFFENYVVMEIEWIVILNKLNFVRILTISILFNHIAYCNDNSWTSRNWSSPKVWRHHYLLQKK